MKATKRIEGCPAPLRAQVAHAARLAHALDALLDNTHPDDLSYVWLLGRASEVNVYVRAVVGDWLAGRLDAHEAAAVVESYVEGIHGALRDLFGGPYMPSCCRFTSGRIEVAPKAMRPRYDSRAGTLTAAGIRRDN